MTRERIPVELAFIFVILAFVAGFCLRGVISRVRRAMAGRDRHIDWDVASEDFGHIPTASAPPPPPYRPSSGKSSKFQNYAVIIIVVLATTGIATSVWGVTPDDSLRIYAVNVVKTTPFEKPFTGYGIYLGKGAVITAAHVIGRWGFLKDPHVLIAGQYLPAKILKEGSIEQTDVTLLSVDEMRLPASLQLRRNPLCKQPPQVGENVIVIDPEKTAYTQIISPLFIAPEFRWKFNTLIRDLVGASGSGVFNVERRCLMGIISRSVPKYEYRQQHGSIIAELVSSAGYFVSASKIADFIPPEFRF